MTAGAPSTYNQEVADKIIEQLSCGIPMTKICKQSGMPSYPTLMKWMNDFPEFLELSTRAKIDGTHALADQCLEIADSDELDPKDKRVRIDTRLRLIGKWNARAYGDKLELGGTGEGGALNIVVKQFKVD